MRKILQITLLLLIRCIGGPVIAQEVDTMEVDSIVYVEEENFPPLQEFRGVWIASVNNIDYPLNSSLGAEAKKDEWLALLDDMKATGFNAVIVQIRPAADAFYPSKLAPWSKYLTGKQGRKPKPYYDPLEFMIKSAHRRGLEFHAWLNPLRASMDLNTADLDQTHPYFSQPEWIVEYGNRMYFDPGIPEVREYVVEVVGEILMSYDVDAIHFDDYFYPYKRAGEEFNDSTSFAKYGFGYFHKGDWRRNNIDRIVEQISRKVDVLAPHVKFGISPFGVWRNKDKDPVNGSATFAGQTSYDDLHANILKWLEMDWIDYIIPQMYWHIGFPAADYNVLLDWWTGKTFGKHLYAGHAAYKVGNDAQPEWSERDQISRQIQLARDSQLVLGSTFFSANHIQKNKLGITDTLKTYYEYPALIPPMPEMQMPVPPAPELKPIEIKNGKIVLEWDITDNPEAAKPAYSVIYRFKSYKPENMFDGRNLLAVVPYNDKNSLTYVDETVSDGVTYTYIVALSNRLHEQSDLSNFKTIKKTGKKLQKMGGVGR